MAQSVSLWGATYSDVPAIEVPKSGGGMASFTDVTDTTAIASDVLSGKYFYTAAGEKTLGTGSGGGGGSVTQDANGYIVLPSTGGGGTSVQTATGTFTGSGSITQSISCSFAPDLICVYGDLSGSVNLRGVVSFVIVKDTSIIVTGDGSTSAYSENLYDAQYNISGYGSSSHPHATYSSGTLTLDMVTDSNATRFNSSVTYNYKLVKWT